MGKVYCKKKNVNILQKEDSQFRKAYISAAEKY